VGAIKDAHAGPVYSVAIKKDKNGTDVVISGGKDGCVKMWTIKVSLPIKLLGSFLFNFRLLLF